MHLYLRLMLACMDVILLSVTVLMSVSFGLYNLMSLFVFPMCPFCHEE